jgi:hypothetical protein
MSTYILNVIYTKILMSFCKEIEKILKFTKNHKRTKVFKAIKYLKKNNAEGILVPDFKLY